MSIFITGASGFVGSNLIKILNDKFSIYCYKRKTPIFINQKIVLHLAGKAHDTRNNLDSNEYYDANVELTQRIFDEFIASDAEVFITLSSVKAVADSVNGILTEDHVPNPVTHYGKSKLLAEQYITSRGIPSGKRIYILRPCMIHGPNNKGNLNLLYNWTLKGLPWPLGAFENQRSFCSIENLLFFLTEIIEREDIPSGIYNVADDNPISTNQIITIMAESRKSKPKLWKCSQFAIRRFARMGTLFNLPFNEERLEKLTESYIVSNQKLKTAIGKSLPVTVHQGFVNTLETFK
jgi:nucleoside-diphosphate-sugar epimerase